ncbi:MAG: helix-turn-helix domain-containing protein [Acidimicrobiaceae bacterium]|nr:helix-turn-helix domain-containing protein [Acidimicrobiaceae bacterium]
MAHTRESHSEWLGSKETAEMLGISLRTIYRLVDDGQLPAYQIGRVIRFKRDEVEAFIESTRIQPGDLRHLYEMKAQSGQEE